MKGLLASVLHSLDAILEERVIKYPEGRIGLGCLVLDMPEQWNLLWVLKFCNQIFPLFVEWNHNFLLPWSSCLKVECSGFSCIKRWGCILISRFQSFTQHFKACRRTYRCPSLEPPFVNCPSWASVETWQTQWQRIRYTVTASQWRVKGCPNSWLLQMQWNVNPLLWWIQSNW